MSAIIQALREPPSPKEAHVYQVSGCMGIFTFWFGNFLIFVPNLHLSLHIRRKMASTLPSSSQLRNLLHRI